ncbi:sulfotransferase 1C4-like [Paramacrobiotus metropolitanus]|uniref:sulfotransferase 1C4-like n=1 Tax=Paramacrobiotus metropolitanus TaxID=2943436 RepID=UPI0024458FC4|nr:sulfotransferase 1C4-like [Paramacrobiotus metropolitanus]
MASPDDNPKQNATVVPKKVEGPEAYKYKFHDKDFLQNYHGTRVFYPFYLTIPSIEKFEADPSDVAIVTFPKCGTTFMTAILHMINNDASPKCMTEGPNLETYFPYMEMCTPNMPVGARPIDRMLAMKPPRHFYTHFGWDALPKSVIEKAKIIYVARNPKDTIVSMHHFMRATPSAAFKGTIEETFESFVNNRCIYAPFWDHVADFWSKHKNHSNIFFTTFERLLKDFKGETQRLARFLGKEFTDEQLDTILFHCNFDAMKKNKLTNREAIAAAGYWDFNISHFMRAGKVGNWKTELPPELNKRVDEWIESEQNRLKDKLQGLEFEYE